MEITLLPRWIGMCDSILEIGSGRKRRWTAMRFVDALRRFEVVISTNDQNNHISVHIAVSDVQIYNLTKAHC